MRKKRKNQKEEEKVGSKGKETRGIKTKEKEEEEIQRTHEVREWKKDEKRKEKKNDDGGRKRRGTDMERNDNREKEG